MGFLKRIFGGDKPRPAPDTGALDALTIQQLANAGADLRLPRETIHYLYVPTEDGAHTAEHALTATGRIIVVRPAATGNQWLVLLTQSMVVSQASMTELRAEIESVSAQVGGEYDGWEAAVTPD